jgi:hypothetical protein
VLRMGDLEDALAVLLRDGERPRVNLYWGCLPQIRPRDPAAENLDDAADVFCAGRSPGSAPVGRPNRNAFLVALIAYMRDIEGRAVVGEGQARRMACDVVGGPRFGLHEFLAASAGRASVDLSDATGRVDVESFDAGLVRGALRSRTVDYYACRGREILAAHGAWPYAVMPCDRLPKAWRQDPLFADALAAWASPAEGTLVHDLGTHGGSEPPRAKRKPRVSGAF